MKRARSGAITLGALVCVMALMVASASAQTTNRAPRITSAAATPSAGYGTPLTVAFSATATDSNGDTLTYSWDFGDGGTSTAQNPTHSYQQLGYYDAALTVSDGNGGTATRTIQVNVLSTERDPDARFRILVFSKTAAFRHSSIDEGVTAIRKLGAENDFQVDATEESSLMTDENLALYDAVVFLSTTGDVLNDEQQAAFERFIRGSGGYVGIHAASDTEYTWKWYGDLSARTSAAIPRSRRRLSNRGSQRPFDAPPARALDALRRVVRLQARQLRGDRQRRLQPARQSPRARLARRATYTGEATGTTDHPISWCHRYDGGRSWYTALGHTEASYVEPEFLSHILGGIEVAAGVATSKACGRKGWHGTNPKQSRRQPRRQQQRPRGRQAPLSRSHGRHRPQCIHEAPLRRGFVVVQAGRGRRGRRLAHARADAPRRLRRRMHVQRREDRPAGAGHAFVMIRTWTWSLLPVDLAAS